REVTSPTKGVTIARCQSLPIRLTLRKRITRMASRSNQVSCEKAGLSMAPRRKQRRIARRALAEYHGGEALLPLQAPPEEHRPAHGAALQPGLAVHFDTGVRLRPRRDLRCVRVRIGQAGS